MCIKTIESVGPMCLGIKSQKRKSFSILFLAKNAPVSTGWRGEKSLDVVEKHVQKIDYMCIKIPRIDE